MIEFILNNQDIRTALPTGTTVLDFVRYHKNLKGTKIGCREGDCGACTILVGESNGENVNYRTMTSCLIPLANAAGKHIVTIEGINPEDGSLTPAQQAMVDESGTQCGFCTVGFVMSLTGFCVDETAKTPEMAVSSIDGNICRCTGYKSIERAAVRICDAVTQRRGDTESESVPPAVAGGLRSAIEKMMVPKYFEGIADRLRAIEFRGEKPPKVGILNFVSGGTDVYVQKPDAMADSEAAHLFYSEELRGIRDTGEFIEIGASATVTDLLISPIMQRIFPDLYKHLKLVSSTPIRNMATLAGNFVNASPIGDMTVWFLALDAEIEVRTASGGDRGFVSSLYKEGVAAAPADGVIPRQIKLRDLYLGYKQLAKSDDEIITKIHFRKPAGDFRFNFEKVCKRTYLDIATVNTAISLRLESNRPVRPNSEAIDASGTLALQSIDPIITDAHVAAGGVSPIPLYLKETSAFLKGKEVNHQTIEQANEIMQSEISPISDVRGTEKYKRLLLKQLFTAHFYEIFRQNAV